MRLITPLKPVWRWGLRAVALVVGLAVAVLIGFSIYAVTALPDLKPWHTEILKQEFSASRDADLDFDGYLKLEERLFAEMRARIAKWDQSDEAFVYSRFNPASGVSRLVDGAPYNRSFRLQHPSPVGRALLIHGLTDSPYSMKALAESLHAKGFEVTVLRVPGHGTLPSMMTEMTLRDWKAAVRIAARDVAGRTRPGELFYVGGYSTGGTLALEYALDALTDSSLRRPDRVLLISPAIEITRMADLANLLELFTVLPIHDLQKARWQAVGVEYDPYKFNSFPINATRQVNRATKKLQAKLAEASEDGSIAHLPPVIAWQSVVDATVGSLGAADILFASLNGQKHQLVLFDVNRHAALGSIQRPAAGALIARLSHGTRRYTLDIVSNRSSSETRISVRRLSPDGSASVRETALEWPPTLVSVGHVALPFPPNDPVYGVNPGSGRNGMQSIGSWLFRGENGAVTVDLGSLTRPRSNPFWALIDEEVGAAIETDRGRRRP